MEDSFIKITKTKPRADQINLLGVLSYILLNTVNGKYCCNGGGNMVKCSQYGAVSIPQAVSTVATLNQMMLYGLQRTVSIPQAVSTVATLNQMMLYGLQRTVSIPQAVSTVATVLELPYTSEIKVVSIPQAVSTVATSVNKLTPDNLPRFNTASGKYCCNL